MCAILIMPMSKQYIRIIRFSGMVYYGNYRSACTLLLFPLHRLYRRHLFLVHNDIHVVIS